MEKWHSGSEITGTTCSEIIGTISAKRLALFRPFYAPKYHCFLQGTFFVVVQPEGDLFPEVRYPFLDQRLFDRSSLGIRIAAWTTAPPATAHTEVVQLIRTNN